MKRPLIIFPTTYEADAVFKFFNEPLKCTLGGTCRFSLPNGTECEALVSGVGCEKSASRVRECVKNFCPTDIILCGFGGACDEDIEAGEFIFESKSTEIGKFLAKKGMRSGKIAFSKTVADKTRKSELSKEGYEAVEMESKLFEEASGEDEEFMPVFTHIRCISDTIAADIPATIVESGINRATGGLKVSFGIVLKEILKNPKVLLTFIKFMKTAKGAKKIYDTKIPQIISSL